MGVFVSEKVYYVTKQGAQFNNLIRARLTGPGADRKLKK